MEVFEKSRLKNEVAICEGRCEIIRGSDLHLHFGDDLIDIATAYASGRFRVDSWKDPQTGFVPLQINDSTLTIIHNK